MKTGVVRIKRSCPECGAEYSYSSVPDGVVVKTSCVACNGVKAVEPTAEADELSS